jgi:Zn-finger nucleic acid-binding protein
MDCPRCPDHPALTERSRSASDIKALAHECPSCGGQLFARKDFQAISEVPGEHKPDFERIPEPGAQLKPLACPSCADDPMLKVQSRRESAVTMDVCAACHAIWLDVGELEAIRGHEHSFASAAWEWFKNR